ncbi:MAG: M1 family aminopeptidase [Saprospiraceae bacterium]
MTLVALFLVSMVWVVGVTSQTLQGYFNYEFGKYFTDLYLLEFPLYMQLVILAFFVHILVNKKFLGHVIAISVWLVLFGINTIGEVNFNMFLYSYRPNYLISDMNGFGHFMAPVSWFNVYWLALGGILLIIGNLLWNRGAEDHWKSRLKLMRGRWNKRAAMGVIGLLAIWVSSGAFIYYNVKTLNSYQTSKTQEKNSVAYEEQYSKYATVIQPKIITVNVKADIYAKERRTELNGIFKIVNKSSQTIDSLYLTFTGPKSQSDFTAFTIGGKEPAQLFADDKQRFYIYKMPDPMLPGDTLDMNMQIAGGFKGFPNSGYGQNIIYNGTFFNSGAFPSFGYNAGRELTSDLDRKKYKLAPKAYNAPPQTDPFGLSNFLFEDDADWVMFEATVSTDPGQIAIAPGYLQKEWEENGRHYYHYKMDTEMLNFYNFSSANYEVARDVWSGAAGEKVNIEIFHDAKHHYNIDRFIGAVKASFDYFNANFSPYQFRQMRILEFPRYSTFAQSFPNTVPYAESFGWVGDFSDPDDSDYAFFVTAHEVAHQWWAHQITPSNTRGANQLSETMAEYAALMVMKKEYGGEAMQKFLKYELDRYLSGRAGESKFEKTLLDNDNQAYVWYRKGSLIMYALQDYVTEDSLNRAFSDFLKDAAFRPEPPFANSLEWYSYIESATPDSLRYFIEDSFKKITLYENRMKTVTYESLADGKYKVKLTFDSKKIYYDGNGLALEEPTAANLIEIGIFGEDGKNEKGMKKMEPIYLQKHWIKPGENSLEFTIDSKPVKAGIDPYNKLIDRISDDNMIPAEEL